MSFRTTVVVGDLDGGNDPAQEAIFPHSYPDEVVDRILGLLDLLVIAGHELVHERVVQFFG